ncbi:hypothetical protein RclHR1_11320008 [Rhizophagus clarus]|uniref:Uncharacterized protein n=1 Tax=Rhizophagus clarus TaxID=94130 RepID=A0A2Z6QVS0_9GLOM|nr:hypothetical protein RclHR1_11320008 [Rhizophagus clarus]GES76904.1 hypothetical protein GLOIN_2v1590557 [Rhizophagus clarus]
MDIEESRKSLDNLMVKVEPPNTDVFYVKEDLKEILIYFKKCEMGSFNVPFIKEKIHEINKQGIEFNCCLRQSITQSNKLESHAENVMAYIQILEDPIFDSNRILNILETLLENARMNMEETQQIRDKYNDIKNKLSKINDEFFIHNDEDEKRIQSLPAKKEELEELEDDKNDGITAVTGISFTIGLILLICGLVSNTSGIDKISLLNQKLKNEIKELDNLNELKHSEKVIDIENLCKNLFSVIIQVETFRTYWETQYYILYDLNKNLRAESNNLQKDCSIKQSKKVLLGPIKNRWERVKAQCDSYTKSVRNLITEIKNV